MYIAFRWLVCMSLIMWLCLCVIEPYTKNKKNSSSDIELGIKKRLYHNATRTLLLTRHKEVNKNVENNGHSKNIFLLYNIMFLAGACAVTVYYKKNEISTCLRKNIFKVYDEVLKRTDYINYHAVFAIVADALLKYFTVFWQFCNKIGAGIKFQSVLYHQLAYTPENYNVFLIKKLKQLEEQRKSLGKLFIAVIQENKNIRLRYQLENTAKKRLMQNVEESQNEIKKKRCQYVSFQQLYLVTNQENIFLKSRLSKLTKEKEMTEKNLLGLINQICLSNNNELKAYCSRIIVKTKNNLLNSDVKAEIEEFLKTSHRSAFKIFNNNNPTSDKESESSSDQSTHIEEIFDTDVNLVTLVKGPPKLRGLPGECVWTLKDKNGLIEKLYECAYETDLDNHDTVRKIREYSVYYDKDCILDSKRSLSNVGSANSNESGKKYLTCNFKSHNFLSDSPAFQTFLRNNKNFLQFSKPTPSLLNE